ncbi:MAG: autotransporter-associated beta strand repeat-containing protein [Tepidisphaeraceae bacterium]
MKFSTRSKYKLAMAATVAVAGAFGESGFGAGNLVSYTGGTYAPNFGSLPNVTTPGSADPPVTLSSPSGTIGTPADLSTAFEAFNASYSEPALDGWWFASAGTAQKVGVGIPNTTTGALFIFGNSSGSPALGAISTSSTGIEYFGVELQNETGGNLNTVNISFTDYLAWANTAKPLDMGYFVDNSTASSDSLPTGASLTNVGAVASTFATGATAGSTENQSDTITLTGGNVISNGGAIWLVWSTSTSAGTSQGVGINGLSASLSNVASPSVTWAKSSGTWDDVTANWSGASTTYADGETVTFANSLTSNSMVTVQGGGVSPNSVTINNTTGHTYTFAGGSINGSGSVTNTAGTTVLSVANGYTGGTIINGGTVIADGDATLGGSNGGITLAGGTLQAGAAIGSTGTPSQRSITVNPGGGTFNTNGFNSVTSGPATIDDVFNVNGSGGLEIDGAVAFSSTGALNIGSGATVTLGYSGTISQINNSNIDGKLVITGTPRLNTDGAVISSAASTGEIDVANGGTLEQSPVNTATPDVTYTTYNTGVYFTNANTGTSGTIDVPIKLNSNNQTFTAADVTQSNANFLTGASETNNFTVTMGGTTGGGITLNGVISGNSDLNIANAPGGGGKGSLVLGAANTYTGTTLINTNGTLQLAVPYAIPTTSDVIFGTIKGAEGATTEIDLDGNIEQFNSLSSGQFSKPADENITNSSSNPATLVISGSTTPANSFQGSLSDGASVGGLSLVKQGSGTLALCGASSYSGGTTISGGTVQTSTPLVPPVGSFTPLGLGTVAVNSPAILDLDGNSPLIGNLSGSGTVDNVSAGGTPTFTLSPAGNSNFSGVIQNTTGSVAVNVLGFGTQGLSGSNTYTGGTTVSAGTLVINPTSTPAATSALPSGGSVSINGGLLQLAPNVTSAGSGPAVTSSVNISSLSIAGGSAFDINNNHVILTGDPVSTIYTYLQNGYNGGNWNGLGGIDTSAPLAVNSLKYGLGFAEGGDANAPAGLSAGQIEVAYTLLGDAKLEGTVNGPDLSILAANFNQSFTAWDQGDFQYDGIVNGPDLAELAANYNQGDSGAASAGDVAALDAFAAANGVSLPSSSLSQSSVPEPASMGLIALGAIGMLARRRRSRERQ